MMATASGRRDIGYWTASDNNCCLIADSDTSTAVRCIPALASASGVGLSFI